LTGKPLEAFEDKTVFDRDRRMSDTAYTVVNRIPNPDSSEKPTYVKTQCMHCLDPACVSACLVGSLTLNDTGAVTYDAWKCIGCRYCMVACPFEVPTYEFLNPLTPQVRKCDFCFDRVKNEGKIPACAEMCPPMCLSFGKYTEVLKQAHTKIKNDPDRYIDHVYGETELGGTSWLYLAGRDFKELGFQTFGPETIPSLTETIQHNVFKYGIPPVMLFGLLSASMWAIKGKDHTSTHNPSSEGKDDVHP
jgi:Fe-S-cluster-containing dehydrogenase component